MHTIYIEARFSLKICDCRCALLDLFRSFVYNLSQNSKLRRNKNKLSFLTNKLHVPIYSAIIIHLRVYLRWHWHTNLLTRSCTFASAWALLLLLTVHIICLAWFSFKIPNIKLNRFFRWKIVTFTKSILSHCIQCRFHLVLVNQCVHYDNVKCFVHTRTMEYVAGRGRCGTERSC